MVQVRSVRSENGTDIANPAPGTRETSISMVSNVGAGDRTKEEIFTKHATFLIYNTWLEYNREVNINYKLQEQLLTF